MVFCCLNFVFLNRYGRSARGRSLLAADKIVHLATIGEIQFDLDVVA